MKVVASRPRRALFLFALAAVFTGFNVSPAAAGTSSSGIASCDELFSSVGSLASSGIAARDDDGPREPSLNETYEAIPLSARGKGGPNFRAAIPVYFHVVSPDGVVGNVTDQQIADQIRVMNFAFSGFYGGADSGFRFKLAAVTRTVNADWFNAGPGRRPSVR